MLIVAEAAYLRHPGRDPKSIVPRDLPALLTRKDGSRLKPVLSDAAEGIEGAGMTVREEKVVCPTASYHL